MKKIILSIAAILTIIGQTQAQSGNKPQLSAFTRQYLALVKGQYPLVRIPGYVYKSISGKTYISTLIKVHDWVNEEAIKNLGVYIGTKAGSIWTLQVPIEKIEELTQVSGIANIDLDAPIFPMLDAARKATRADSAQKGINLPYPLTGHGVVVGIIDAGFDFNHPTLYDTSHTTYRVKRVWRQKIGGTPPSGYWYGSELADPYMIRGSGTDTAITPHGTHVAGIAAGSGWGSTGNDKFRGMAYESDMVMVGIMPPPSQWAVAGTSDIIDGLSYIFNYATSVYKPCVVNLSWGSSIGPHDGQSFFCQAVDALTGPGRIFACSAGNNGGDTIHLQQTFTTTNNTVSTFVTFSPYLDSNNKQTWLDIWGDTGKSFCLNLKLYDGATTIDSTGIICISDTSHTYSLVGSDGDTCFVTLSLTGNEYNGKPHAFVALHSFTSDNLCLTATATSGTINIWEGYVYPPTGYYGAMKKLGYAWAVDGDTKMTTSDYSSCFSAISVGAYTSKSGFTNISGASLGYPGAVNGRIAPFSSLGPAVGNRIKPDITGPGFALASSISSYDTSYWPGGNNYNAVISKVNVGGRDYIYAMAAGTSMSSPAVSGIIAMMLQVYPLLTPDSVKKIINATAITDLYTGTITAAGNNIWGHGKINAYKAIKYMLQPSIIENTMNEDPLQCFLYPNPSRDGFNICYTSNTSLNLLIQIYDITGRIITCETWDVAPGTNSKHFTNTGFSGGMYYTKISSGDKFKVIKTIIN